MKIKHFYFWIAPIAVGLALTGCQTPQQDEAQDTEGTPTAEEVTEEQSQAQVLASKKVASIPTLRDENTGKTESTEAKNEEKTEETKAPARIDEAKKESQEKEEPAKTESTAAAAKSEGSVVVTTSEAASKSPFHGKVALVNLQKKFVVVNFQGSEIPPLRSELGVYRDGIFIGSLRITDPIKPPLATADVVTGTLRRGDVVR
ncbi:MAG: hypothetical protein PHV34_01460 [Verrucomicrobiae bacterium]|nr:hypothetical protein [Verrucomicrobiae bacterium]